MNRNKLNLLFIAFLFCGISALAQPPKKHFSPQSFVKDMECFIKREANLSKNEADAFFPIFHEMHEKQRVLNREVMELKKKCLPTEADDKEYQKLVNEVNHLKIESAELENTYYRKMCKVVPAKKVFAAMKAKDKFHRKMLQRIDERKRKK